MQKGLHCLLDGFLGSKDLKIKKRSSDVTNHALIQAIMPSGAEIPKCGVRGAWRFPKLLFGKSGPALALN